ncbi:MAG: HEAT repeat domain-containing protein [Anaerolineales bacterium]|jgi:HEAT repeat protein|nr:HEAT repeat domain-containing protein [Anaerolineales bacterium]MCW5888393.1 HEAT repeat domain-containing protein [Anaerolineales bacterium]
MTNEIPMDDFDAGAQSEVDFRQVLAALQDEHTPLAMRTLYRLSALEAEDLAALKTLWPQLPLARRRAVLEESEGLAESNQVMHFDSLNEMALSDADAGVRTLAARGLWITEQARLVTPLVHMLQHDPDSEARAQAADTLGRFVYLGEVGDIPAAAHQAAESALLDVLHGSEDPLIQRRALEAMGFSSRPEIAEMIEEAFEGGEEEWVSTALFAMGRSADERWSPMVIQSLSDPNREISREAARAAGELELSEARPGLFDLLQDEESEVRLAAAWALSQIGGNGISDVLEEMIERSEDDDEIELLESAIENLAFTNEMDELSLLDFSPEDLDDFANPDLPDDTDEDSDE